MDMLMIEREEQQEKMDLHKSKNVGLKTEEKMVETQITKAMEEIEDTHERIAFAKEDKNIADAKLVGL